MPLFGANTRGDFVGMPTCWPHDARSDPSGEGENVIMLDIDLLLQKKTIAEVRALAETRPVFSVPGLTFMSALSDRAGNVLHIVPGQGVRYYEKPEYKILTNFSPFKGDSEKHPWMGLDRYRKAEEIAPRRAGGFRRAGLLRRPSRRFAGGVPDGRLHGPRRGRNDRPVVRGQAVGQGPLREARAGRSEGGRSRCSRVLTGGASA